MGESNCPSDREVKLAINQFLWVNLHSETKLSDAETLATEIFGLIQKNNGEWVQSPKERGKMRHGEEETHYCCNKRLAEDGGNSKCCGCYPHHGCTA